MITEPVREDLLDLGAASRQIRGGAWGVMDQESTLRMFGGLSAD